MRMPPLSGKTSIALLFALCAVLALPAEAGSPSPGVGFWTITPCRLVDTRSGAPLGPGAHTFQVAGVCGIPAGTVAVSLSGVTVVNPPVAGSLAVYQAGIPFPGTSALNWNAGRTLASHTISGLSPAGAVDVFISLASPSAVHIVLDSAGYFGDTPPTAVADTATVTEDDAATAIPVLTNDTDPDGGPMAIASASDPANGTVVLTGGTPGAHTGLTYQPDPDYCNTPPGTTLDTFTYTLNGGSTATVSVTVTCVDDLPEALDDAATVAEDDAATAVPVLGNDTDAENDPFTIQSVTQPANGTVVITGGGTGLTYGPNPDYCNTPPGTTPDTFTYTLTPGGSTATVSMTVTCVDDPPVAVDDSATVGEDSGASAVPVLTNDTDVDAGPISITSVTQPANGTVVITGGGTGLTYQPNPDYCNTPPGTTLDTFTYTLTPGSSTATVSMTVTCGDDNPVAVNDAATVLEDSVANAINVLLNDTDVDGGPISITSVTQPANGAVVITGGGTGLDYTPNAQYCNNPPGTSPDTFTYTLTPGGSTATVSVTVTCENDGPLVDLNGAQAGFNFAVTFTEGDVPVLLEDGVDPDAATITDVDSTTIMSLTVTLTNLLDATFEVLDADVSGFPSITKAYDTITTPGTGVLTLSAVTGQPIGDFQSVLRTVTYVNTDQDPDETLRSVTFLANDGTNDGNTATSDVTVVAVDDPPVAVDDLATVAEDSGASAIPVLTNDTDVDAGPISIQSVTQPPNGTVVITGGGTGLTYQPNANYCNDGAGIVAGAVAGDAFTYTLTPGGDIGNVEVTVTCADDPPTAVADSATVAEDSGASAIDVLTNDTDPDAGPKSIQSVTQPTNGTVVITGGGTGLTYQPNANYCNTPPGTTLDTFTYTLTPGGSSTTVTMTVTCVDDNPVAVADAATVTEDSGANAIDVLANDTDIDAGPKSVGSVTQPVNGTVVITGGGTGLTYAPNPNYCNAPPGTTLDTFTYTLTPGSSSTTVTVTVTCVDDPPVAVADSATVLEDSGANAINVLANDTDIDAGPKSVFSVTQPANGVVVITGGGTGLTYAPNPNYCNNPPGTTLDTFTYTLTPGSSSTTVTMTVTCVNDPPVADNDPFDFIGNTELVVDRAAPSTPHTFENTGPAPFGVLEGDSDPVEGNNIAVTSITVGACTDNVGPYPLVCTDAAVGTVTMDADGKFSFLPAPGDAGASETFQYTVTDDGVPAPASTVATVTLTRFERVWYVKNDGAAGNGTSASPFNAITAANLSDTGGDGDLTDDLDFAGDYLFVYFGDGATTGQAGGLALEGGQHLIGEHNGLSLPVSLNGNGAPTNLVTAAAGNRPLLGNATAGGNAVSATDVVPAEILGVSLAGNGTGGNALDWTTAVAFAGSGTFTVSGNVIRGAGAEGVDVNLNAGTTGTLTLSITSNSWSLGGTHTGNAVDINRAAGTFNLNFSDNPNILSSATAVSINGGAAANTLITGFANNSVHGNTGGSGIVVANVTFDTNSDAPYQQVSGGTTAIGISGNGVGGAGMSLSGIEGDLAFTDLDIFAEAGAGLVISGTGVVNTGAGTGTRATVGVGVGIIEATGGPALNLSAMTGDFQLTTLKSTSSTSTGVSLVSYAGAVSAGAGSSISGPSGTAFNVSSSAPTVSYAGSITANGSRAVSISNAAAAGCGTQTFSGAINGSGASASGILVNNCNAGTITFSGSTLTLSTQANHALTLTGNAGSTINFSGNLSLATTTGRGLLASGGGAINVTGADNTISTTNGTAFEVFGTAGVHMGGAYTFKSISSANGTKGIRLQFHDGPFTVTGDGPDADALPDSLTSGGTISNITNRGAELIDVSGAISLGGMTFTNAATANGAAVSVCGLPVTGDTTQCNAPLHLVNAPAGVTLRTILVNGSAQHGINANNVTNLTMTGVEVTGAGNETDESGVMLTNVKGTGSITSCNFHDNHARALHLTNTNGTLAAFPIKGTTFSNSSNNQGLLVEVHNSGTVATVAVGGTLAGEACTFANTFGNGFEANASSSASLTFSVRGSSITNTNGVVAANAASGTIDSTVQGNTFIAGANTGAGAISIASSNGGTLTVDVLGNTIGSALAGSGSACAGCNGMFINPHSTGSVNMEIRGNIIQNVNGGGIIFRSGNVAASYNHNVFITGNVIRDPGPSAITSSLALEIRNGITSGPPEDSGCLAVTLGGPTNYGGASTNTDAMNIFEDGWNGASSDIFLFTRFATTTKLPSYAAPFDTYVRARNSVPAAPGTTVSSLHQNTSVAIAGTSCP